MNFILKVRERKTKKIRHTRTYKVICKSSYLTCYDKKKYLYFRRSKAWRNVSFVQFARISAGYCVPLNISFFFFFKKRKAFLKYVFRNWIHSSYWTKYRRKGPSSLYRIIGQTFRWNLGRFESLSMINQASFQICRIKTKIF